MSAVEQGASFLRCIAHNITTIWVRGGWIGVDLFFVLSGFLVSGLLFREHQKFGVISGKNFLIRRGLKIYPAFWLLIGITAAVQLFQHTFRFKPYISEILFIQNYFTSIWAHTWSLAVEEHFYISLLLYFVVLARSNTPNPFRQIPSTFVVVAGLSLALRLATSYGSPHYSHRIHLFPSHLRMDSLFFGVLISYIYHHYPSRCITLATRYRLFAMLIGTLFLVPAFAFSLESTRFISTFGLTLFYLGSGLILIAALVTDVEQKRIMRMIAYVGSHSYSIYLWHIPIAEWLVPWAKASMGHYWNWGIYFILYFLGSICSGIVMAVIIEFPILKIRDRLFPSRANPLSTSEKPNNASHLISDPLRVTER